MLNLDLVIARKRFPSPCGVKVVGNGVAGTYGIDTDAMFPSPCGVKVVGNFVRSLSLRVN